MSFFKPKTGSDGPITESDLPSTVKTKLGNIGDLSQLKTSNKSSLTAATNEVSAQLADEAAYVRGKKTYPLMAPHPQVNNPVLNGSSVTDRTAQGVADPFICYENGVYHMFFEVISAGAEEIGHAYSHDGLTWTYTQVVISEAGQHFAYPHTFKYQGKWYMIPDKGNSLDVYEATNFPLQWRKLKTILPIQAVDATLFEYRGRWYFHVKEGNVVNLYYSDGDWLSGRWTKHPSSPILNSTYDRGAGRPYVYDDCIILPMQGFFTAYGDYAKWVKLSNLSPTTVTVTTGPMFINGQKNGLWNARGMHHSDHVEGLDNSVIVCDGIKGSSPNDWSIGIYTESAKQDVRGKVYLHADQNITEVNTWVPINIGANSNNVVYDTMYNMWDRTNKEFTIPQNGFYRVKLQVAEYSLTVYRNIRARVFDKTSNKELCINSLSIPAGGGAAHNNTLICDTVVYLAKDTKIACDFRTSVATFLAPNVQNSFFEIEKIY